MTDEKGDADSYQVQVKVLTDDNPGETSWKIKNALGWEPRVGLRDGLERTIDYYREHKDRYL